MFPFHIQGAIPTPNPDRVISPEQFASTLGASDKLVVGERGTRSQQGKTMLQGFDPYGSRRTTKTAGGGVGGAGGDDHIRTTPSPAVPLKPARSQARVYSRGVGGGARVQTKTSKHIQCCCDSPDCLEDASGSEHYCSFTGRRCFSFCQSGDNEGHGSKKTPCVRCAQVEKA